MRNNITALVHPETLRKMRAALWIARIEATKKAKARKAQGGMACGQYACEARQYITNARGHNYLRLSVYVEHDGGQSVRVYGDQARDVTGLVMRATMRASA